MNQIRLVFCYDGGEKSVLTVDGIGKEELHDIAQTIADAKQDFVLLDLPTAKQDLLLIYKPKFIFFYATPVVAKD